MSKHPIRSPRTVIAALLLSLVGCDSSTQPDDLPAACDLDSSPQLAVGEAVGSEGAGARVVCVTAPGTGGEYVLVVFAATTSSDDGIPLAVRGEGTAPTEHPPVPVAAREASGYRAHTSAMGALPIPLPDEGVHAGLRRLEQRHLRSRIRPGSPPAAGPSTAAASSLPAEGDLLTFNTQARNPCEDPIQRVGRVQVISDAAIVVADTSGPDGGFDQEDYQHFAATFDTLIMPLAERSFGTTSDIAGNGRTILFFTEEVNRLSPSNSDSFIGGFFFARDLFPRETTDRFEGCPHSNEAEILYLMVPDPQGTVGNNPRSREFVRRVTYNTLIHEIQHLINSAQRLHLLQSATPFEEIWLNEGLSHIGEELLFYETSDFSPGQNLGPDRFPAGSRARELLNRHQITNTFRLELFLENPSRNSPYHSRDLLATRGATWHFLRYAADRKGGDQSALLRSLVQSDTGGLQNLADAFITGDGRLSQWFTDWTVTLFADESVEGTEDRFQDRSWNHRALFGAINEDEEVPFPLRVRTVEHETVLSEDLLGGGAAYFRFRVEGGQTGLLELTSLGSSPPPALRAVLMRTR